MSSYESKSDTELEQIVKDAKKSEDELTEKLLAKFKERQEAINKGDKNIVNEIDKQTHILRSTNPFKDPLLRDTYNTAKSTMF